MKTSWTDARDIEAYLQGGEPEEQLLFEARLILQPGLEESLAWQEKAYGLVQQYGRRQLKEEIDAVHRKLFTAPQHNGFRRRIMALFSKK